MSSPEPPSPPSVAMTLERIRVYSCIKIDGWIKDESDAVVMYRQLAAFYLHVLPKVAEAFMEIATQEKAHMEFLIKLKEGLKCE